MTIAIFAIISAAIILVLTGAISSGLFELIRTAIKRWIDKPSGSLKGYLRKVASEHEILDTIDPERDDLRLKDIYVTLKMARKVSRQAASDVDDPRVAQMIDHRAWRDWGSGWLWGSWRKYTWTTRLKRII
jgi:hypothetical protein